MSFVERLDKVSTQLGQGLKSVWFMGHYIAALRMGGGVLDLQSNSAVKTDRPMPDRENFLRVISELLERDQNNQNAGLYVSSESPAAEIMSSAKRSFAFFRDVPKVDRRRREGGHNEVHLDHENPDLYPRYYLQNFHYQTDGYLSDKSAEIYDFQVETLFSGTASAMRRQALVPMANFMRGKDQRQMSMMDVACGTGQLLRSVKLTYPRLAVTALDLSPHYLERAKSALSAWTRTDFVRANAENIPSEDGVHDIVTCVYLFHELPPKVRPIVAKEIARILKPGGLYVHVDTLQMGDHPEFDALLEMFPRALHEPYYSTYVQEDLATLFAEQGLVKLSDDNAFLTKVTVFSKPEN